MSPPLYGRIHSASGKGGGRCGWANKPLAHNLETANAASTRTGRGGDIKSLDSGFAAQIKHILKTLSSAE